MRISDWSSDVCSSDLAVPPIAAPLRRLVEWVADYYLAPPAAVLKMVMASAAALDGGRSVIEYRPTGIVPDRLTPQRALAIERLRSEEHTSELQSLMRISYAVFCLKKKKNVSQQDTEHNPTDSDDPRHHNI